MTDFGGKNEYFLVILFTSFSGSLVSGISGAVQSGQALTGKDGILTPLIKQLTETALAAELDSHLAQDFEVNRKKWFRKKRPLKPRLAALSWQLHVIVMVIFEPQLVKKHQTTLSDELERKIIRLFALGMSYRDISREIEDLYAFSVSTATISAVTDKVIPELKTVAAAPAGKGLSLRLAGRHSL